VKSRRQTWFINYLPIRKTARCAKPLGSGRTLVKKRERGKEKKVQGSRKSSVLSEKERTKIGRPGAESRESQTRDAYKEDIGGHGAREFAFVHLQNEFSTEIFLVEV